MLHITPSIRRRVKDVPLRFPDPEPKVVTTEVVREVKVPSPVDLTPMGQAVGELRALVEQQAAKIEYLTAKTESLEALIRAPVITTIERDERGIAQRTVSQRETV